MGRNPHGPESRIPEIGGTTALHPRREWRDSRSREGAWAHTVRRDIARPADRHTHAPHAPLSTKLVTSLRMLGDALQASQDPKGKSPDQDPKEPPVGPWPIQARGGRTTRCTPLPPPPEPGGPSKWERSSHIHRLGAVGARYDSPDDARRAEESLWLGKASALNLNRL